MKFRVRGADRESGEERELFMDCATAQEARAKANAAGYLVSEVAPTPDSNHTTTSMNSKKLAGISMGVMALLTLGAAMWFVVGFLRNGDHSAPSSAVAVGTTIPAVHVGATTTTTANSRSAKAALTLADVTAFVDEFGRRLSARLTDKETSVAVLGTKADIRQMNSLVHPVVAAITLEVLTTESRQTGNYSYNRIKRLQYDLTLARKDGAWELVEGSFEVLSDVQLPDDVVPTTTGQKSSANLDPDIEMVLLQMNRDQAEPK